MGRDPSVYFAECSKIFNSLKLQQAIDSCDERILECIGGSDSDQDGKSSIEKDKRSIKDEVKYIDKGEYYTQTIIKFASNYVGER
ncbi:14317_t:CDS:2, partial [Funneliformis mosseae]